MRRFLFEDKDYQYRPSFRRNRNASKDAGREMARLLRTASKAFRSARSASPRQPDMRQKCIAKMQYSGSKEAHTVQLEKYLIREGAGQDGKAPALFGTDLEEYREKMVGRNFRIFLSPESPNVDVKALAEKFMDKLTKQTGYDFFWQGATHYNTAHPHAHLLINGVDKQGREITIPKDIVKTFMRENARNLCTEQVGRRTQKDLEIESDRELVAPRFTRLDNQISELSVRQRVTIDGSVKNKERILARLETLKKLQLCKYENGGYTLKASWQDDLKNNSRYNTFLTARKELQFTDPSLMNVYTGEQGTITGKVTKIYRPEDDTSNNHIAVLEGLNGKAYFVPFLKRPEVYDSGKKTLLKEGEFITLKTFESQTGRLTPIMLMQNTRTIQKEIKKNNYSGALAKTVNQTKEITFT